MLLVQSRTQASLIVYTMFRLEAAKPDAGKVAKGGVTCQQRKKGHTRPTFHSYQAGWSGMNGGRLYGHLYHAIRTPTNRRVSFHDLGWPT